MSYGDATLLLIGIAGVLGVLGGALQGIYHVYRDMYAPPYSRIYRLDVLSERASEEPAATVSGRGR